MMAQIGKAEFCSRVLITQKALRLAIIAGGRMKIDHACSSLPVERDRGLLSVSPLSNNLMSAT